jgi:SPOR domain
MLMRNVFLIALVVNVTVFMFYYYVPDNSASVRPALPANVNKLVLLSEVDKASLRSEEVMLDAVVDEKKVKKEAVVKECFTIGPFREESKIISFKAQIKTKVKKIGIRERVEKEHWRYWVYLPSAGTKAKAVKQASDLAKKGLKDYYVIARGEHKNSISLGHFKDKLLAEKRLKAIKKMSYKPKMQAIVKEYTLYWLDYVAKSRHGISNKVLESFELEESIHQFKRECAK